jgi:SAM-dependent methyltransferase
MKLEPFLSVKTRSHEKEIMDLEYASFEETSETYRLIRRVNRYLGGSSVILAHLERFARGWNRAKTLRILDAAAGIADIPQAIVRWARKKGQSIHVTALDINPHALAFGRAELAGYPEISFLRGSIFDPPFLEGSFDYVISSMFFHHLTEEEAARVLKISSELARRGVIVNDLLRKRGAYLGILFLSRFSRNAMFRNDAPLSVLRGFRRPEVESLIESSGLGYLRFHRHCFYRFAIAGEKNAGF